MLPKSVGKLHWWFKEKWSHIYKKVFLFTKKSKIKYYEKRYFKEFGVELNINNPVNFYDKINYLKFYYFDDKMTDYTDKIKAKTIASSFKSECKIAKVLNNFESFKDFSKWCDSSLNSISSQCVLKTNNGSGAVFFLLPSNGKLVIRDKHGKECSVLEMKKLIKKSIKINWYIQEFEKNYRNIEPHIFIEEYFPSLEGKGLNEYKFFCNFGDIRLINVVYSRQDDAHLEEVFTDPSLKPLPVKQNRQIIDESRIIKPSFFDEMVLFAKHFSKSFPFLRVDLMCDSQSFYFCEFTFYDFGGLSCFYPAEYNRIIGDMFRL